mgnify:CR=1 FL=1
MKIERGELEKTTLQWLDNNITDGDYDNWSTSYLAHRKYRLYKYQNPFAFPDSRERFFTQLSTNTLSLSAPSVFNDPFDCRFAIPPTFGEETMGMIGKLVDSMWRVGSLTERPDNLLMWAHYAGAYRGVCIEYDFSDFSEEKEQCSLMPVIYRSSRVSLPDKILGQILGQLDQTVLKPDLKQLSKVFFIKSKDWQYEFEWRLLKNVEGEDSKAKYTTFKMPPIKRIYLGAQCSIEQGWIYDTLREICDANRIEIVKTCINTESYKIDIL